MFNNISCFASDYLLFRDAYEKEPEYEQTIENYDNNDDLSAGGYCRSRDDLVAREAGPS